MTEKNKSIVNYLFVPKGRASRYELLFVCFAIAAIELILCYFLLRIFETYFVFSIALCLTIGLPTTWIEIVFDVRRLHDLGKSAWHLLFRLIPIVGQIYLLIILLFFKGQDGANSYGEDRREKVYSTYPLICLFFFILIIVLVSVQYALEMFTYLTYYL